MAPPSWIRDAVFYQIFPDRFANGDTSNDPPDVQPWGATPTTSGFQGGDLRGIRQNLEYLADLGVNALYLNPIFQAGSNHRYNTSEYLRIDDRLGSLEDLRDLLRTAHDRGMRVLLDGVFNHSGRGFFAFQDLLDREERSPYRHWYHIHGLPLDAFGEVGKAANYEAWWGIRSLPKFNTDHPDVRAYLLRTARYWIEQGIDGWRLDVPNEIPDLSFWGELRAVVKDANPDAALLGEIWTVGPAWVGASAFDGLMNYPLREALLDLVVDRRLKPAAFVDRARTLYEAYPEPYRLTHYNLLGSHDTERLTTLAGGDARRVRLLYALLFALPGAPSIYYGDEIGLEGGKDPDCRRAFEWDTSQWDIARRRFLQDLIRLRHSRVELRRGDLRFLSADPASGVLALARTDPQGMTLLVANLSDTPTQASVPVADLAGRSGPILKDALNGDGIAVSDGRLALSLGPNDFALLHTVDGPGV